MRDETSRSARNGAPLSAEGEASRPGKDGEDGFVDVPFTVEPAYDGWRLDRYLTAKLKRLSRTRVRAILARGLVAERPLKPATRLRSGLRFCVRRRALEEPETPTDVEIVHGDDWILVVDKPAGLPVHPSARYHHGTLVALLRRRFGEGWAEPVHRLDRETSGLVICARTPEASRWFMHAFRRSAIHKEYLALCEGEPPSHFVVEAPIALGGHLVRIAVRIDPVTGRPARTRFEVVERLTRDGAPFALVRAHPETGRQHQIRVHLRAAGYPIVGDKIYGRDEALYDRFVTGRLTEADHRQLRLERHALHAHRLTFAHPATGRTVHFEAPLPADLRAFLAGGNAAHQPDGASVPTQV